MYMSHAANRQNTSQTRATVEGTDRPVDMLRTPILEFNLLPKIPRKKRSIPRKKRWIPRRTNRRVKRMTGWTSQHMPSNPEHTCCRRGRGRTSCAAPSASWSRSGTHSSCRSPPPRREGRCSSRTLPKPKSYSQYKHITGTGLLCGAKHSCTVSVDAI